MTEETPLNNPFSTIETINSDPSVLPENEGPMSTPETQIPTPTQPEPILNIPTSEPTPIISTAAIPEMPVVTTPALTPPPKGGHKKGLLITGLLGLSAVAIITVLSFSIKSSTKEATTPSQAATETTPTTTPAGSLALTFENLKDGDVSNAKTLKVTGSTGTKATVSVVGGADDVVFETDGTAFSVDVPLALGSNKLVFTAQDSSDNQVTETRNILYSEELAQ